MTCLFRKISCDKFGIIHQSHNYLYVMMNNIQLLYLINGNSFSGVSRISFRGGGGGSKFFWKSGGICHAARAKVTRLLGGFGGMLLRENF